MTPPLPDVTILKLPLLLIERGARALPFVGFWRPPNAPPPPPTPQCLTILMTERGAPLSFVGFWRPPPQRPNT